MRATPHPAFILAGLILAAATIGCGRKPMAETPIPDVGSTRPATPTTSTESPRASSASSSTDMGRPAPLDGASRATLETRIHFDFDRWALSDDARASLTAKAGILRANASIGLRIEGHADEQGSDEYNLVLSNRRAMEAKRYLTQHGIGTDRLETVGQGEEHPLEAGHHEQAWAMNRRAEFIVTDTR